MGNGHDIVLSGMKSILHGMDRLPAEWVSWQQYPLETSHHSATCSQITAVQRWLQMEWTVLLKNKTFKILTSDGNLATDSS